MSARASGSSARPASVSLTLCVERSNSITPSSFSRLRTPAETAHGTIGPGALTQIAEEGWVALAELKEQGLVRHIGISNFDVNQLRLIAQIAPVETLQSAAERLGKVEVVVRIDALAGLLQALEVLAVVCVLPALQ